jgi:hypothetical protein
LKIYHHTTTLDASFSLRNVVIYFILIGVFSGLYIELTCILLCALIIIFKKDFKIGFSKYLILGLAFVLVVSLINESINNYEISKTIQQFLLLIVFLSAYTVIFKFLKNNLLNLFDIYLKFAFYISLMGLLQFFIYFLAGINIFYFASKSTSQFYPGIIRVSSIISEPAYLGGIIIPALVYFMFSKKETSSNFKKYHFIVILLALISTFSSASYLVLIIAALYKIFYRKSLIFIIISILLIGFYTSLIINSGKLGNARAINNKLTDTFENTYSGLINPEIKYFETLNSSSYALLTNLHIALNSPSRLLGTGLGTHEQNYYSLYTSRILEYGQNAQDGYSLAIRIYSELGLVGIIFLFIFLIKNFNNKNPINIASFFLILQLILRGGHYTLYGTIFFFFLYFYSSKSNYKIMQN